LPEKTSCSSPECCADIENLTARISELEEINAKLQQLDAVMRRNNALFTALLANSAQGIALTAPDRRIMRVVHGLTGFDAREMTGELIESVAVPDDRKMVIDAYQQLLRRACTQANLELRVERADGTIACYSATITDMLDDPNVQAIVWNYSDITMLRSV
jgi:PAS domain S-box-containing protein